LLYGLMGRLARSIAIGVRMEVRFHLGFQHHLDDHLGHAVSDGGNA
jgi:hypothetical protein